MKDLTLYRNANGDLSTIPGLHGADGVGIPAVEGVTVAQVEDWKGLAARLIPLRRKRDEWEKIAEQRGQAIVNLAAELAEARAEIALLEDELASYEAKT